MKLILGSILAVMIIALIPSAFADSITVTTDKDSYTKGETIRISGHTNGPSDLPVTLQVLNPVGNLVEVQQLTRIVNGTFFDDVWIDDIDSKWRLEGEYTVRVTHYTQSRVATTTFTITDSQIQPVTIPTNNTNQIPTNNTIPFTVTTDKDNYQYGDIVQVSVHNLTSSPYTLVSLVVAPNNTILFLNDQIDPANNWFHSYLINATDGLWSQTGEYTIIVYLERRGNFITNTTFTLTNTQTQLGKIPTVQETIEQWLLDFRAMTDSQKETKYAEAIKKIEKKNNAIANLKENIEELKESAKSKNLNSVTAELVSKLERKDMKIDRLENKIDELKAKVEKLQDKVKTKVDNKDAKIDAWKNQTSYLEDKVKWLEGADDLPIGYYTEQPQQNNTKSWIKIDKKIYTIGDTINITALPIVNPKLKTYSDDSFDYPTWESLQLYSVNSDDWGKWNGVITTDSQTCYRVLPYELDKFNEWKTSDHKMKYNGLSAKVIREQNSTHGVWYTYYQVPESEIDSETQYTDYNNKKFLLKECPMQDGVVISTTANVTKYDRFNPHLFKLVKGTDYADPFSNRDFPSPGGLSTTIALTDFKIIPPIQ